ncbi:MAG: hypothetical protein M3033_05465 [Acidobacteriota bacterium]|nr:hypothetical protein [Acidobacteriota bacterium]
METEQKPKRKPFGDLYNELVLTRKDLKEVELFGTVCPRETEIAADLFGLKIVFGKHQIDCDTELEARFLRIFAELGWREVKMPRDEKYLAKILPEIEALKERADRLYFEREKTIFSRKLRREVKMKYYRKISKTYAEFLAEKPKSGRRSKSVQPAN